MRPAIFFSLADQHFACRPTYAALVSAEDETGSLFALVERASGGALKLSEIVAVLWHCLADKPDIVTRDGFSGLCVEAGLAQVTPVFRQLMEQALSGA